MAEWFKAAVLKTAVPLRVPGVRIPLHPLFLVADLRLANILGVCLVQGSLAVSSNSGARLDD